MQRGPGRSSTLTSIAAEAGVSVSTVSKVLNGRTDVAPRTRERIGQLLRGYGYQVAPGIAVSAWWTCSSVPARPVGRGAHPGGGGRGP